MAIVIKICCRFHAPARGESWAEITTDQNVIVEIPDRCVTGGALKHKVWAPVAVKVSYYSPACTSYQRMRIGVRHVSRHRRVIKVVPPLNEKMIRPYTRDEIDMLAPRKMDVIPRITWLQGLMRPCLCSGHGVNWCIAANQIATAPARLVQSHQQLVNLVLIASVPDGSAA